MDLLLTAVYVIAALTTTGLSQETYVIPFVERSSLGQTFQSVLQDSFISGNLFVTLNAANSAQISIDAATDASECGVAINLTGNMQCLEEYDLYVSRSLGIPDEYGVYECRNPYQIIYDCGEGTNSTAVNDSLTLVTSDLQSLIDFNFSTVWAYRMTDSPVTITLELPEPFQMNIIIMAVETVPIDTEFYASLGGGDETSLGRLVAVETSSCQFPDNCFFYDTQPMHILGHYTDGLVTMDKLRVVFSGTNLLSYTISHLVIRELYISATCACASGTCSEEIDLTSTRSILAKYSCDCSDIPSVEGFLCDNCAIGYYNDSGVCSDCNCGFGATNKSCNAAAECQCDSSLYSSYIPGDSKCNTSYISDISPLAGTVAGGTLVTIKGGLLSQIDLDFCNEVRDDTCINCPSRDAEMVCKMSAGETGSIHLVTAASPSGESVTYNFTYLPQYVITDIQPQESFASGGRELSVYGNLFNFSKSVTLEYDITCLLSSESFKYSKQCEVVNSSLVTCLSLDFCSIPNNCSRSGVSNSQYCHNKQSNSIGATSQSVSMELAVNIDGVQVKTQGSYLPFNISRDPAINEWENSLLVIPGDAEDFTVPGKFLTSGATFSDYRVEIEGVSVSPLDLNETRLRVQWPNQIRPLGLTNVSVGSITVTVGTLDVQEEEPTPIPWLIIGIAIGGGVLLVIVIAVPIIIWKKKSQLALAKLSNKFACKPGDIRYVTRKGEMSFVPLSRLASDTQLVEQLKPFFIDKERISLSSQLGAGQFGKVYKGTIQFDDARQITVAAKTLKSDSGITEEIIISFLKEAMLMSNFKHANVLSLIGVVYAESGMPIVVLPFMQHGDIRSLLHKDDEVFVLGDLLHFAMQIARGMEYLSNQRFIHRDLATRNCMVDGEYMVKIADFGLSHDIYEDDYYRTDESSSKPLPVKWMAIESLNTGRFTTESDVWSYGVVMWELLTRGVTPYPLVSNYEVKSHLIEGNRLQQPQHCPDFIFDMMKSCWLTEPKDRPSFADLADKLQDILSQSNYEERSKTHKIQSDYYLQPLSMDDQLDQLHLQLIE